MENIEKKIDDMMAERLMILIQENTRRIKNINIRYTTSNRKNSLECVEAGYESYNRLLRGLSRDLVTIEKKVREKFAEPLKKERKIMALSYINTEADLILKNIEEKFNAEYKKLDQEEIFLKRFAESQKKFKENLDAYATKFLDPLFENSTQGPKYKPVELSEIYGIDKSFMVEMNFIAPLQTISSVFDGLKEKPATQIHYDTIKHFIREMVKELLYTPEEKAESFEERKARKRFIAKESILISELLLTIQVLAEQLPVPFDQRNKVMTEKIWERFQKTLNDKKDTEKYLSGLRSFYDFIQNDEG